jgi:cytochrome c
MVVGWGADMLFEPHYPETAGFMPDIAAASEEGGPAAPEGPPDFGAAYADPAALAALVQRGERLFGACASCHTREAGGANGQGPAMWNVFGRTAGTHAGFGYSAAMSAYGQPWTYENLYAFLERPSGYISGTAMSYAGLRRSEDRVALVAYLHSLSDSPAPIPAPRPVEAAAPVEAEAAPAEAAPAP